MLAVSGVALGAVLVLIARALRARTRRRFDAMLHRVDDHLGSISESLQDVLDRSVEVAADAVKEHELTWDGLASAHERPGYEAELEREVARATSTQRPLSLIVVGVRDLAGSEPIESVAAELLTLLGRVTRTSDRVVRRGDDQLVVLLPGTTAEAAWRFHGRLRVELEKSFDLPGEKLTVLTDVVEWEPNETSKSFDARAHRAGGGTDVEPLERLTDALDMPGTR